MGFSNGQIVYYLNQVITNKQWKNTESQQSLIDHLEIVESFDLIGWFQSADQNRFQCKEIS